MKEQDIKRLLKRLCVVDEAVVYFPVRHHSPVAAFLVRQLITELKPNAVLIEGPFDYNPLMDELALDHHPPIAIYSYFRAEGDGSGSTPLHSGCYYPFCDYSPEWQAIRTASAQDIPARFIDLPWKDIATADHATHRYSDAEFRTSQYIASLCKKLHVEDFDDLWDRIVESHERLTLAEYLERVHGLCLNMRLWEHQIPESDILREQFMAEQIAQAVDESSGQVLVITGGFHSSALVARLEGLRCPGVAPAKKARQPESLEIAEAGVALTTFSYQRLDGLSGYNAGMPSPGFYEQAWLQRREKQAFDHQPLLKQLVAALRDHKQTLNTADLIAVETTASALAAIRGRNHVWRRDLIDAVTSSLVKDELEYGCESPFVSAVQAVLRGDRRGSLDERTTMPPLVSNIQSLLDDKGLTPKRSSRTLELDLLEPEGIANSRILHQLQVLGIRGFSRSGGTDFLKRDNLERLWESWLIRWSPEFESSCIEASRYGTSLSYAVTNCLTERLRKSDNDAAETARLLVVAAQTGSQSFSPELIESLGLQLAAESRFSSAAQALGHLLFLFCYDEAFGTARLSELAVLLYEALARTLWLLELLGKNAPNDGSLVKGMRVICETYERAGEDIGQSTADFVEVLGRIQTDTEKPPQVRGGTSGILWRIGYSDRDAVMGSLLEFTDPEQMGDFLAGLFTLAREEVQRNPDLLRSIDHVLLDFGADDFNCALPALRLAFTSFTPREKHLMLTTLFRDLGHKQVMPLAALQVDSEVAAEALAMEERLFETLTQYGLEQTDDGI